MYVHTVGFITTIVRVECYFQPMAYENRALSLSEIDFF